MTAGLNEAKLIGHLGADPELKYTQSGAAVLKLRLATSVQIRSSGEEKREITDWHTVVVWGKRAEGLARFLEKGARLFVSGRISYRSWEAKDGTKRNTTEINADQVIALDGPQKRDTAPDSSSSPAPYRTYVPPTTNAPAEDFGDDDIPF